MQSTKTWNFNIWHASFWNFNILPAKSCDFNFLRVKLHNLSICHYNIKSWNLLLSCIDCNAPCSPLPPKKILHDHCFQFLLGITVIPREIIDNGYAIWGVNKVHYGLCENGEFINSACQILKFRYLAYEIIRHAKSWNFRIPHAIRVMLDIPSQYTLYCQVYMHCCPPRSIVWSLLCYCVRARDHCCVFLWRHSRLDIHLVHSAPAAKS